MLKMGSEIEIMLKNQEKTKIKINEKNVGYFTENLLNENERNYELAAILLPECYRILKIDWIQTDSMENGYFWAFYETNSKQKFVSIFKIKFKGNGVEELSILYLLEENSNILDCDCIRTQKELENNILGMMAICTENMKINFVNLPIEIAYHDALQKIVLKPIKSLEVTQKIVLFSWNQKNPEFIAFTNPEFSLFLLDIEKEQLICKFNKIHYMEITRILWIHDEFEKSILVTSSHDGNIKFWDIEDPFAPSFVHSTGQRWIYNIEWDPLLKILHYNSEGKNNSYSYLAFIGISAPILKKYILNSQATFVNFWLL